MDERIKLAISEHEGYQRLAKIFPLEFLIECLTNNRRREPQLTMGRIVRDYGTDPTLFVAQVLYHERLEFEELRRLGYTDHQLGAPSNETPHFPVADLVAKRGELKFMQDIGEKIIGARLPFLAIVSGGFSVAPDYKIPGLEYHIWLKSIEKRVADGLKEYQDPFTLEDTKKSIELYKLGGERCSGESLAISLATRYVSKERPHPQRTIEPWEMA